MDKRLDPDALADGVRQGNRAALSRAITLVESTRADHRTAAAAVLDRLAADTGRSIRIGLSGVPGVGKSTLVDAFGTMLTAEGHKVAVLAVDPSSTRTGGSILGDKTRMPRLSVDPSAYIRPSPSSGTLGGVAARTRETMLLCEAAGFDVVIVETMGVGQSEIVVAEMVDLVLLLMIAGGGDELQGIKKGILEIADIIAMNKADGDNAVRAKSAAAEIRAALNILTPRSAAWRVPVLTVSGLNGAGLVGLWDEIRRFRDIHTADGSFASRRADQRVHWLKSAIDDGIRRRILADDGIRTALEAGESAVRAGERAPTAVAEAILDRLGFGTDAPPRD
ncbi:methylmalonyl Co-A mutase-associated GTPase MeaB [Aurantimonas endophytica]|uniref:LAO/AO transport system kinase n=1 Tax=Aurantimonas endophytica TaxID=1522175 RepID=A0A7W6HGS9_9HYPH|nr:methylmalonyl Co-A mutase-associated GTPase MeaB [Aurantimonas endophytica]MBB4004964.1 LAO/AO transport system kinase [Aurantimonas endophytica]MCO6405770.1 methylmalonyl Co-A mutase-associated GTPase MeaB [Aurantimonas endophytica]